MTKRLWPEFNLDLKTLLFQTHQKFVYSIVLIKNFLNRIQVDLKNFLKPQSIQPQPATPKTFGWALRASNQQRAINKTKPSLCILGSRGIPAKYGGFETFAERLSLYLVSQGWNVTVYCQDDLGQEVVETHWNSVRLIYIPTPLRNAIGTIIFDWESTVHASKQDGIILTLGYNTAIFCFLYRLKGITNLINMDGMEWHRQKWKSLEKLWLYLNERLACWLGNHLIADHPEIKAHLSKYVPSEKITVIPYGSEEISEVNFTLLQPYNLSPNQYILVIARPEPENSILEIVSAFSSKTRNFKLVVLGCYFADVAYHKKVMDVASNEVIFPGAIYEKAVVSSFRFYARLYIHGHTVGGTNPSLVEALSKGVPVLAQDNSFNRWVAGLGAHYFKDRTECAEELDRLLDDEQELNKMKLASLNHYHNNFSGERDLETYKSLLELYVELPVYSGSYTSEVQ